MLSAEQESIQQDNNTSQPTERDKLLSELFAHINAERDAEALALFDGLDETDIIKKATSYLDIELFDTPLKIPLLGVAAYFGLLQLASRLLELGHRINKPIVCTENPRLDKLSPLMLACASEQFELAKLLIKHKANLLRLNANGDCVFIQVKSIAMLDLVMQTAKKQKKLEALLRLKNAQGQSAIEQLIENKEGPELIEHLIRFIGLENVANYVELSELLAKLRKQATQNPKNSLAYRPLIRSLEASEKSAPYTEDISKINGWALTEQLLEYIYQFNDTKALAFFNKIYETHKATLSSLSFVAKQSNHTIKMSLLEMAAYHGLEKLAARFIELGHAVNSQTSCTDNPAYDKRSPLMLACGNNQIDVARLLINQQADLLAVKSEGNNLCIEIKSNEILELIIESAQKQNKLEALLKHKNNQGKSAIEQLFSIKKPTLIKLSLFVASTTVFFSVSFFKA